MHFSCLLVVLDVLDFSHLSLRMREPLGLRQYVRLKHSDNSYFESSKVCLSVISSIK